MEIGRIYNELAGEAAHRPEISRLNNEKMGEAAHEQVIGVVFNDAALVKKG